MFCHCIWWLLAHGWINWRQTDVKTPVIDISANSFDVTIIIKDYCPFVTVPKPVAS
jgi:hypothetical protein